MIQKILLMWLIFLSVHHVQGQTIHLQDNETGEPLAFATIFSDNPYLISITDAEGKADISAFKKAAKIEIRIVGYITSTVSYAELEANHFKLGLIASVVSLNQVIVSVYEDDIGRETSLNIKSLQINEIDQKGSFNLTDALDEVPGVSKLSSGIGISKPVIRGLYGNRILVLFSGLRFDNQQWQDEHGLGLSDIGISRVELIKGPLSVLYGTEAVGGVINLIEEQAPLIGTSESDVKLETHSNSLGASLEAGTKANYGKRWYRLRIGTDSYGDYTDGNGDRVLNSRFNGQYLKASYGFKRKNWKSDNQYHFSYTKYGFVFDGNVGKYIDEGSAWRRKMEGPHHIVMLNILSSNNTIKLRKSKLELNVGIQSNRRSEDEGANELSLDMHLLTTQYAVKWKQALGNGITLIIANNSSLENNTNLGKRKLVPDALTAESALSVYLKKRNDKFILESGIGVGSRYLKTMLTPTVNSEEKEIDPFAQNRPFYNGMLGFSWLPNINWNIKANVSSGVRAPNLSELSSNGLHEGIYTYEIGDPDMSNEQNYNANLEVYFSNENWKISGSVFYNYFDNYIYLQPTLEDWFGFPVYRFVQQDAVLYGTEISVEKNLTQYLSFSASYEGLVGKLNKEEYLPYMPAQKIRPELKYSKNRKWFCFVNTDFVFQQKLVNTEETSTPAYELVNAGIGFKLHKSRVNYTFNLVGNNLLNKAYYSHLSRFKRFGLLNMGRDISLNLKIKFNNNLKK